MKKEENVFSTEIGTRKEIKKALAPVLPAAYPNRAQLPISAKQEVWVQLSELHTTPLGHSVQITEDDIVSRELTVASAAEAGALDSYSSIRGVIRTNCLYGMIAGNVYAQVRRLIGDPDILEVYSLNLKVRATSADAKDFVEFLEDFSEGLGWRLVFRHVFRGILRDTLESMGYSIGSGNTTTFEK